ncbi:hypothetical protein [Nakamurella endophytica]|uniref:Uncharacterized protein n=1 Tax=Nakamurella endophytica TaxID=1748367 RepID=A0A917T1S3_9ACTN|nr:hypothetical protein [Nakamurella endophytica]GGM07209.1 hypothetical protein GCM10011594_29020 [Nakamurella endophytica]
MDAQGPRTDPGEDAPGDGTAALVPERTGGGADAAAPGAGADAERFSTHGDRAEDAAFKGDAVASDGQWAGNH